MKLRAHKLTTIAAAAVAAALLSGCVTPPEEDPVLIRLDDLDGRLRRIEAVVSNQSLLQLAQQLDSIQAEVRSLRGRLEELQNGNDALRKQQLDTYADLDRRLAALEAGPRAGGRAGGGDQAAYDRAFEVLKGGDYAAAITLFRQFLADHPDSTLAANAAYWLGEAYYVTRDFTSAATAFERVMRDWPASQKAPDALLKLGYSQAELKRTDAARATLGEVIVRFPGTEAARLARERLQRLSPAT